MFNNNKNCQMYIGNRSSKLIKHGGENTKVLGSTSVTFSM